MPDLSDTLITNSMAQVGAFFDVDRTLVSCNTGRLFLRDLRRRGEISFLRALRAHGLDGEVSPVADRPQRGGRQAGPADARVGPSATSPSAAAAGSRTTSCRCSCRAPCARSSATAPRGTCWRSCRRRPTYVTRPIAEALGIDEVISTQFEVDGGPLHRPPGRPGLRRQGQGPLGRGPGGAQAQLDLGASWFYTDSYTDLPMLERVGNRVVVNPDPRLRRAAKRRGWPVRGLAAGDGVATETARERLFGPLVHAGGAAAARPGARGGRRPRRRHHRVGDRRDAGGRGGHRRRASGGGVRPGRRRGGVHPLRLADARAHEGRRRRSGRARRRPWRRCAGRRRRCWPASGRR